MMKIVSIFLCIGMSMLWSNMVMSQTPVSLGDLINRALMENYQIQMVHREASIAANNNTLGMAGFLPSINLVGQATTSNTNTFIQFNSGETRVGQNAQSNAINAYVEANWIVFDGLSMFARKEQLSRLEQLGSIQTRYYVEQTVSDLAKAYYRLIMERRLLENLRQSLEISRFRRELERRKVEIGTGTGLLYRQAIVDFNTDSAMLINQQAAIRGLEIQLNRLINQNLEEILVPTDEEIPLTLLYQDSIRLQASRLNRDIMAAQLEELISDARYREELGRRLPEVSVFGSYAFSRQTNEVGLTQMNRNYGPQVGIRVRLNLYNGNQQNIRVRNMEIEREIAGLEKENVAQLIDATLLDYFNWHQSLQQQLTLMGQSLTSATEALEIAQRQLAAGAINGYDFRLTQLALLQVRNNLVGLTYEQKYREIDILRISGKLMDMRL